MIKLVEISYDSYLDQFHLREIVVNSSHIISIVEDAETAGIHAEGKLPEGLHSAQEFSKVMLTNGKEIIVVGNPDVVGAKTKNILHG